MAAVGAVGAVAAGFGGAVAAAGLSGAGLVSDCTEPAGVACFSVAGRPEAVEVCRPLRGLHQWLADREGPNDGLVSVESASAFGTPLDAWPVDHLRQMNWLSPEVSAVPCPKVARLYADVVENLANLDVERPERTGRESA